MSELSFAKRLIDHTEIPSAIVDRVTLSLICCNQNFQEFVSRRNLPLKFDRLDRTRLGWREHPEIKLTEHKGNGFCLIQLDVQLKEELEQAQRQIKLDQMIEEAYKIQLENHDFLHKVFNTVATTLIVVSTEGHIVHINRHAEKLLGWDAANCLGLSFFDVIEDSNGIPQTFDSFKSLESTEIDFAVGNSRVTMLVFTNPFYTKSGNLSGFVCSASDITRLKQVTEELIEARDRAQVASRAKSEFLSNMSHELRTPLNAIIGYAELAEEDILDGEFDGLNEAINVMKKSGYYLLELVNGVLDLAKIEDGRAEVNATDFSLEGLAKQIQTMVEPLAIKKSNRFKISLSGDQPQIWSDQQKLKQVLINLIGNACKFTENGVIELCISEESDGVRFAVRDTGRGIPPEKQKLVFERFGQAHDVNSQKLAGTGLGLTISQSLVKLLGSQGIELKSELGKGSEFSFLIPRVKMTDEAMDAFKVLIVDDEAAIREYLIDCIGDGSIKYFEAENGDQGLSLFMTKKPDLVLTDLHLPHKSGIEFIEEISPTETPIYVISGTEIDSLKDKCQQLSVKGFIEKPFSPDEIRDIVRDLRSRDVA